MAGEPLRPGRDPSKLRPCYLFHGEDTFEAREFIEETRTLLFAGRPAEFGVERYDVPETGWPEIVDSARTTGSLFADWRLIVVRVEAKRPKAEEEAADEPAAGPARRAARGDEVVLADYLAMPSERTILVIIVPGPAKKSPPLVNLLKTFEGKTAKVKKLESLKEYNAGDWLNDRAAGLGVRIEPAAADRLFEVAGFDRAVLAGELDKLVLFAGGRKTIKLDDIERLAGWVKSFEGYEIENGLLAADVRQTLVIIDRLFRDGHRPEELVDKIAKFFRDLLMAKVRLREGAERKSVLAEFKPKLAPYNPNYRPVFNAFFGLTDRLSFEDLRGLLGRLRRVDEKLKTSDSAAQALLERFVIEYGAAAEKRGVISPQRRSAARSAG